MWLWGKMPVPGLTLPAIEPDPLAGLVAYLDVPASVRRGTYLAYVVTLSNPTDRPIGFGPCPVFRQELDTIGGRYLLNCVFQMLPPGSWVRMQMRLPVPVTATPGTTTFTWSVESGSTEVAVDNATVTVR